VIEGVQDRGCATGKQSEGKIELLYSHRSVDWLVGWAIGTWPELYVTMIFQPPLSRFVPSLSTILSPGRGVQQAWLLASLFPSCLSLAASRLLLRLPFVLLHLMDVRPTASKLEKN